MGQNISSLISASGSSWAVPVEEGKRQAIASLRGYAYQLHQSLAAWLALPDGATLHLEVAEDYAAIARDPETLNEILTSTQVKDKRESGSVTLNSADILDAVRHFWALREANAGRTVRFAFLTTAPIGKERHAPLASGRPGLEAWALAARGGPVNEIRSALKDRLSDHAEITALLDTGSDKELRRQLLQPIRFFCGAPDIADVEADNRAVIVELGYELGGSPELAGRAADHLLVHVLDTVIGSEDRRLTRGDLLQRLYELVSIRMPSRTALQAEARVARGIDLDATSVWRKAALPLGAFAPRTSAVADIAAIAAEHGVAWIHGATGYGKSILAELVAVRGGEWPILDLRGAGGQAARERLTAVRNRLLVSPEITGLVIDDLSPEIEGDIISELASLAATASRRDMPLLVTSNHPPPRRVERALGTIEAAVYSAPAFDQSDSGDLVAAYGGDRATWAWFTLLVGGQHPQLVDAVIAGLERRGWPTSTLKEWADAGMRNSDVEAEREAARRRLLSVLSGDTLPLLARTARIIGTYDRRLAVAIGEAAPALGRIGLSLDLLTGHWIERVGSQGLRTSPLVSGLDRETYSVEQLRMFDEAICSHLIRRKGIAPDLVDVAFAHAVFAQNGGIVDKIVQMVLKTDDEHRALLSSAMPVFRHATVGLGFLDEYPAERVFLALAQHLLLSSISAPGEVDRSSRKLVEVLDAEGPSLDTEPKTRVAIEGVALMKMLMDSFAFGKIEDWFGLARRLRDIARSDTDYGDLFESKLERDPIRFIFLVHSAYLPGRPSLSRLFDQLETLSTEERRFWLAALAEQDGGVAMVVDNAWMKEVEKEGVHPASEAAEFGRLAEMAAGWNEPLLAGRLYRAQSVMLDEYANDRTAAEAALGAAETKQPGLFQILRSRAKVAWRANDHDLVVALTARLADRLDEADAIEAAFVLREGAMSAGELGQFALARRWFERAAAIVSDARSPTDVFAAGLAADAVWAAFASGDRAGAIRAMASLLERIAAIDPATSSSAWALHVLARHLILWMRAQVEEIRIEEGPVVFLPGIVSNPSPNPALASQPLSPLPPVWMMLVRAAMHEGILPEEALSWSGAGEIRRFPALEVFTRTDLLNYAIRQQSIEDFSRFVLSHAEGTLHMAVADWRTNPPDPIDPVDGKISQLTPADLENDHVRGAFRDAAIAYGIVALGGERPAVDALKAVRSVVIDLAEGDLLSEWSDAPVTAVSDLGSVAAEAIARLAVRDVLTLEELFIHHLRIYEWALRSPHRIAVLAALSDRIRSDWRQVLTERRALLRMPAVAIPAIEAALARERLAKAWVAAVLLAALPAVAVNLAADIRMLLTETARDPPDWTRPD